MKTKKIKLYRLNNAAWFQYFSDFKKLVERYNPTALNIEQLFAVFLTLYANADEAMVLVRKSAITEQADEAEQTRDHIFRGFVDAGKSYLNHFDPAKREAYKRIKVVLDRYGNVAALPNNEETAMIVNLTQEMNEKYAADIALLSLTDWVDALGTANSNYETIVQSRDTERSEQTILRMKTVRVEADANYLEILERIDATMLLNGQEPLPAFIREQNALADRYK